MAQNNPNEEAARVVKELGGQAAVSKAFGITQQAVSLWERKGLPMKWRVLLGALHPDLFGSDARTGNSTKSS